MVKKIGRTAFRSCFFSPGSRGSGTTRWSTQRREMAAAGRAVERKTPGAAPLPVSTRSRRPEEQRQRDDGEQREQRGRGATCTHRPADETKSSEGQDSVATRGTTRDAMFLPRSGSSTIKRSAISGGGARRVRTDLRTRPSRARARTAWQPEGQRAMQCSCRGRVRARRSAA